MVARRPAPVSFLARAFLIVAGVMPGLACVGTDSGQSLVDWKPKPAETIQLPAAEQMIDDLDRIMTAYGTISVKIPDVWGQDRLARFRCEYEAQMAAWLKAGFKGDINASVRRSESEATHVQVGADLIKPLPNGAANTSQTSAISLDTTSKAQAGMDATLPAFSSAADKAPASLESTVVLDEHSNYLNHLNQLRRVNLGDDLADRPGYALYLIRIPVTLSPGPRSRRGKGAIITVSAKPVMNKTTLRSALRNALVNETVNNVTQAICNEWTRDGDRTRGPGTAPFSLVAYADTELFYGHENIELLRDEAAYQLVNDLSDEPHHRVARVSEWVRGELEASYHLLERAATPARSPQLASVVDPLESFGDSVATRDFARIAQMEKAQGEDPLVQKAGGQGMVDENVQARRRRRVVNFLALALKIQAAGINRRLKQDMAAHDPSLVAADLKQISLFEPEVSDQAFHAFEHYVSSKWPLRVYAIEPVIAQQNVADVLGRRTQSALDLVGAGLIGPARGITGIASEHNSADEETAIRLNPTMVGFGAGQSTFGWIFYPRIQTSGSRSGRFMTDLALLFSGRFPNPLGDAQSIEPGQRECTVLIEMPNFVPRIEFITVADWFRTGDVGDGQKSDLERASVLGRKLVAAETALGRAQVEGQYRPEEYQIAADRLKQLRDLMPTQRLVVRVPNSDDTNDSRIFCSQGLQLRPSLLSWHGKPPTRGEESTLFVEGRNFSLHDTHVIAGGKLATSVLMSRNLIQVTIPKDAMSTSSAAGNPLIDINVATSNGVSNHLLIPMITADCPAAHDSSATPAKPVRDENGEQTACPTSAKPTQAALENHSIDKRRLTEIRQHSASDQPNEW